MKRNTIVLLTCLLIAMLTTNYRDPGTVDYIGIAATAIIVISLVLTLINYVLKRRDDKK